MCRLIRAGVDRILTGVFWLYGRFRSWVIDLHVIAGRQVRGPDIDKAGCLLS
jgi:hypothetical protein